MFLPKYSITNKILDSIVRVELDMFYLKAVDVPVEWIKRLKTESLVRRILGELKLLGLSISMEVVSKIVVDEPDRDEKTVDIAKRLNLTIIEKDLQIVLNLINTNKLVDQISYISSKFAQERVLMKEMLQINRLIGERMINFDQFGVFRSSEIKNDAPATHPLSHEVPYQIDDFMSWFENNNSDQIHPLIKFSVSMAELLRIAPFENYNMLTSLFFSSAFLGSVGYDVVHSSIEDEIFRTQDKLNELVVLYEKSGWDLTEIVLYFVNVLQTCVSKSKLRVANIEGVSVKYRSGSGRAVALSERQLLIMEEVTVKNEMTIKQIREVLPLVSDDTILRDLRDLVNKKMIRKKGKTKGATYVLGKMKGFG